MNKYNRLLIIKNKGSAHGTFFGGSFNKLGTDVVNSVYWSPSGGTLNDFQYIKCKWLFELLTGSFTAIHKDYGFISSDIFDVSPRPHSCSQPRGRAWHLLTGHFFRFYSLFFTGSKPNG